MSDRADAIRFAKELFDVTWRHGQADQVADELDAFAQTMRGEHRGEARPLYHPLVPQARKLDTVRQIAADLGLSKPTVVMVQALVDSYRVKLLPALADSFRARLNAKRGVIHARVTTAAPLGADKAAALQAALQKHANRQVLLEPKVDPSIIGGVVAQLDSTVYDGSVTRQLARMRQKLVENV
jgi:F-type H+-transporting ATPase subunit delta